MLLLDPWRGLSQAHAKRAVSAVHANNWNELDNKFNDDDESNELQDDDNYRIDDDDCIFPARNSGLGGDICIVAGQEADMIGFQYNIHNCGYPYTVRYSADWGDGITETGRIADLLPDVDNDLKFNHTYLDVGEYLWSMNLTDITGVTTLSDVIATVVQSQSECHWYNTKFIARVNNHHHVHGHNRHPVVVVTANARVSGSLLASNGSMTGMYVVAAALLLGSVTIVMIRRCFYANQKSNMATLP